MFDYYSQIDDYLSGLLKGEQKLEFEEQLLKDKELAAIVENKQVYDHIADAFIEDKIKSNIQLVENKHKLKKRIINSIFFFTLLFCLGALMLYFNKTVSTKEYLFEEFYIAPNTLALRGKQIQTELSDACFEAHAFLEIGEIAKSKILFEKLVENNSNVCDGMANYLLALISIKENNDLRAIEYLKKVNALSKNKDLIGKAQELNSKIKS